MGNGNYWLDPDGDGNVENAAQMYCDMDDGVVMRLSGHCHLLYGLTLSMLRHRRLDLCVGGQDVREGVHRRDADPDHRKLQRGVPPRAANSAPSAWQFPPAFLLKLRVRANGSCAPTAPLGLG